MSLTFGAIAAIFLVAALVMRKLGAWPKVVPWLTLVAGLGVGGLVGDLLRRGLQAVLAGADAGTRTLLGTGVPLALVVAVAIALVWRMKGGGTPSKWTPWLALAFCPLLAIAGFGALIDGAGNVAASITAGIGSFLGSLT